MLLVTTSLFGTNPKLSPDLQNYNSSAPVQVIVQYVAPQQQSCASLLGSLDCTLNTVLQVGGTVINKLPLLNVVVVQLNTTQLLNLVANPNVTYVSSDRQLSTLLSNAAPAINAQAAWNAHYTGAGVGIALIDSGVN